MKKRIWLQGLLLAMAAVCPSWFGTMARADEPTYQGRTVTAWLGDTISALEKFGPRATDAEPALRKIADDSGNHLQSAAKQALQVIQSPTGKQRK